VRRSALSIFAAICLFTGPVAYGCSCVRNSVADWLRESAAVFTARVISTSPGWITLNGKTLAGQHLTLRVLASFKGNLKPGSTEATSTFNDGGMCGVLVKTGDEVLVYASSVSPIDFDYCNTRFGDGIPADVARLEKLVPPRRRRTET
jgi:hypothetical protein